MKTSNKLLITFAGALIIIPILGMVIVSATQYKKGSYEDRVDFIPKVENFSTLSKNMTSIAVSSTFESVNLSDAKRLALNIQLIKDEKFGVKISDEYKDFININVDENGQLQLTVKKQKQDEENRFRNYAIIYIYTPKTISLTVTNASELVLKSTADTLNLNLNNIGMFYFANGTELNQLNLQAVQVKEFTLRKDKIKSINVAVTDTKFAIESMSFDNAIITTNGNSKVEVTKNEEPKTAQIFKNLVINTNGIAEVKFDNTVINNCSGKFSDQTQVQMPAVNLNQMYKN